jgi:hypothetical protein
MVAGSRAWQPWVFLIAPDVALLAGIGGGLNPGQLHPRAVKLYNALHMFAGPTALAVASFWLAPVWLGATLAWTAHVLFDRAIGFGLRDDAGYSALTIFSKAPHHERHAHQLNKPHAGTALSLTRRHEVQQSESLARLGGLSPRLSL